MRKIKADTKEQAIIKARKIVERESGDGNKRKWLTTSLDSYTNKEYRVELQILEGSPTRGYIAVGRWAATAFDIGDQVIGKVEYAE